MRLSERLAAARANARRFPPDGASHAGHEAEHEVAYTLQRRLPGSGWRSHYGLRIPGPRGRREVDFVLTTPDVGVVVELKNWVGSIDLDDGRLVQRRRPPRAPVDHGPVFRDLEHKLGLLAAYHADHGRPPVELQPLVVFFNHQLQMPAAIRARPDVTTFAQLMEEIPRRGVDDAAPEVVALRQTLDEIGGWDSVSMFGGRTVFGDVHETPVGDRAVHTGVEVLADRGTLGAVFRTPRVSTFLLGRDGTRQEVEADPDAEVAYRAAGQKKVKRVALRHLLAVEFGSATSDGRARPR